MLLATLAYCGGGTGGVEEMALRVLVSSSKLTAEEEGFDGGGGAPY